MMNEEDSMNSVLSCKNLTKTYGNENFYALNQVSMEIQEGELLVIVGASGSGKSTLLNLLGGIDRCTSGNIYFKNTDITKYNEKQLTNYRRNNIGFIYQSFNLIKELTVQENIMLTITKHTKVENILKKVGLQGKKNSYPQNLSGGEPQRVSIARALSKDFDVLFCDEPTGSLDTEMSKQILLLLEELCRKDRKTVVIVTHNKDISKMADRVYTMKNGKIIDEQINKEPLSVKEIEW